MSRYTRSENESMVKHIRDEAVIAGLIPAAAFMSYHPGNASYNIAGYVDCMVQHEDGQYEAVRADFLPKFTYNMTKTDHGRLLEAVVNTMMVFNRHRENAEWAARKAEKERVEKGWPEDLA